MDDRRIKLCQQAPGADWFLIEWRDHEGLSWMEKNRGEHVSRICTSARLVKHSDIEGTRAEMLAIGRAIEAHTKDIGHERCAVDARGDGPVYFWSPRNSKGVKGEVSRAAAEELAAEIRRLAL